MAKEISTLGGAFATVGTAILAGVTFGQVKKLNDAVESCAKYTGKSFMETSVRHIGETAGKGVATAATAVAAGVTFGQVDALNKAVVTCANSTVESSKAAAKATASTLNDAVDGIPGVGHAKGAIHYLAGDEIGGEKAMKSASRTVGVIAGGAGGFVVGGPVGAVAGGVAGGAAADAIISGADSAIHREWRPYGQVAAWDAVANATTDDEIIDGVIGGLVTPAFDALGGLKAGKGFASKAAKPPAAPVDKPNLLRPPKPNQALKAGNKKPPTAPRGQKAPGTQRNAVRKQNPSVNGKVRPSIASTKPQPKQPQSQTPAPGSRASAVSENNPSLNGKARPSTASTRASTAKSSGKSVAAEQTLEGLGGNAEPIPRNPNNALNAFTERESKPQLKQPVPPEPRSRVSAGSENNRSVKGKARPSRVSTKSQPKQPQTPASGSRASAVTENNPSVNGKARPSTASTRASTTKSSVESAAGEQNLEGLGGNVEPIPRNSNNALNAFMEQELTPKQHQLQPKPPSCVQPQQAELVVFASGASGRGTPPFRASKGGSLNKAGKAKRPRSGGRGERERGRKGNEKGSGGSEGPGGPGGPAGSGMGGRPGLSMIHPEGFHHHFGMSDEQFATFQDQGNGTFIATEGFEFVHAVLTTNDHPTTIAIDTTTQQPVQAGGAGALWQTCTGSPIGSNPCAVSNCTNINRGCSVNPQNAGATAHVYLTSQTPNHQIEYMVLMPTCCGNNNHWQCHNNNTNFPLSGQEANVLQARPGTPVMFIRIDRNTAGRKGDKGRGKGEGGSFGPSFNHDGGDGNNGTAH